MAYSTLKLRSNCKNVLLTEYSDAKSTTEIFTFKLFIIREIYVECYNSVSPLRITRIKGRRKEERRK